MTILDLSPGTLDLLFGIEVVGFTHFHCSDFVTLSTPAVLVYPKSTSHAILITLVCPFPVRHRWINDSQVQSEVAVPVRSQCHVAFRGL